MHFPNEVSVFDRLPDRTGASDLKAYARNLSKMEPNSQLLFVWDCDQEGKLRKLQDEMGPNAWVTTHVLALRDNAIAKDGIENKYDEDLLKAYAEETSDAETGKSLRVNLRKDRKTEFAEHVFQHGTKENFKHFDDLHAVVSKLVA